MAYCDGQRVGGIEWLGKSVEREQPRNHLLYLLLLGAAIAYDCALDAQRSVLGNRTAVQCCCQQGHASNLTELQCRLYVNRVEHLLDGDRIGPVVLQDAIQLTEHRRQPQRQRLTPTERYRAVGNTNQG